MQATTGEEETMSKHVGILQVPLDELPAFFQFDKEATIVDVHTNYHFFPARLEIVIESDEMPETPEGGMIPIVHIKYEKMSIMMRQEA